jgi:hypothetical protein
MMNAIWRIFMSRATPQPQQIVTFFNNHPLAQVRKPWISSDPLRPQGIFSSLRAGSFDAAYLNIVRRQGEPWTRLRMPIYEVSTMPGLNTVIAQDVDDKLLWLDDDFKDDDFSFFVHQEELYRWPTDQLSELTTILVETKCAYLGLPQVITSLADIPRSPIYSDNEASNDLMLKIFPARRLQITPTTIQIDCCIWTYILGMIYSITFIISENDDTIYRGEIMAKHFGDYQVLR